MRVKFTTTLNEQLLEALRIQAVKEKTSVNKILERLIEQYLKTLGDSSPT
jgi:predicted HicB family RNase H-like nuclease